MIVLLQTAHASVEPGQNLTIIVTISGKNNTAIQDALVTLQPIPAGNVNPISGTTDPNGQFTSILTTFEEGVTTIKVEAKKSGYQDTSSEIKISTKQAEPQIETKNTTKLESATKNDINPPSSGLWLIIISLIVVASSIFIVFGKSRNKGIKENKGEMTLCIHCNTQMPLNAKVCPKCGKNQNDKKSFCMNCGFTLPLAPDICPRCNKMPPSGVDVKSCRSCGEVIPIVANFCNTCGEGQPE